METVEGLNTVEKKVNRIRKAVTLESCNGNTKERDIRLGYINMISDDKVLDYVLGKYVEPYADYCAGRDVVDRDTEIDTNEFFSRVGGSVSPLLDWFLYRFYIPNEDQEGEYEYLQNLHKYIKDENNPINGSIA